MDLGEEERYAAAALFTLALHMTQVRSKGCNTENQHTTQYTSASSYALQVDAGIAPVTDVGEVCLWGYENNAGCHAVPLTAQYVDGSVPCREPEESLQDDLARAGSASKASEVATARLALFWGWDFIAEAGMLDTVYGGLQIPGRSWRGLKQLPALGGLARSERRSYLKYAHVNVMQLCDRTQTSDKHAVKLTNLGCYPACCSVCRFLAWLSCADGMWVDPVSP